MQSFNSSYLTENAVFTLTKNAHEQLKTIDRSTLEARELERQLSRWEEASSRMGRFVKSRGERYRQCTFENYEIRNDSQRKVVASLVEYAKDAKENIAKGKNVLLIGPKGSGKDHLLCALARRVFMESASVPLWENGVELLEQFHRESMGAGARFDWNSDSPKSCDIWYVSDPVPPEGNLSESKKSAMFKLVDSRYSDLKPTWMTLNVADGAEAETRLGTQTVDRLRHDALVLFCRWESYRS
jgi:DNA replication protein DnaC